MAFNGMTNSAVTIARLSNGDLVKYDGRSSEDITSSCEFYVEMGWEYLGKGAAHSFNGVEQPNDTGVCGFWRRK